MTSTSLSLRCIGRRADTHDVTSWQFVAAEGTLPPVLAGQCVAASCAEVSPPSLQWTHDQAGQALRVLAMVPKDQACEHPDTACHGDACPLARGFYDRLPAARAEAVGQGWLDAGAQRSIALRHGICPYYLGQELLRWADVLVGDVHHGFDPHGQVWGLMQAQEWRLAVLVDEAHNLVERTRQMYSAELRASQIRSAVQAAPADRPCETGAFPHAVFVDDPLEQLKVARLYAQHVASRVTPLPPRKAKAHGGRLRIGYLSADFHTHATSQLMVQMLEQHDRSRFEVTLFSAGPDDGSPMRARIEASTEHFEHLRGQPHEAMARRIRELGIDILVDVKGATHGTLMPVTAQRAAPLQVSWLGFPGTTGAACVDYFIGDPITTPLAHAAHFSEKLAQMPLCYQPNDAKRALPQPSTRSDWGAPEGVPLLCAFHQSYKISEAVFDSWCRLLHAIPGAVLWLMRWNTNVQSALEAAARARGIGPERLCFAPMLPLDQHLSRLACADLYLDAWPCNAHTTAGEALWVGVPVVTVIGETFAQRVAPSLLNAVGLNELVRTSVADYEAEAIALAQDAPRRAALREHLIAQRGGRLFDGERFARDIEALYERMWARAVAGAPPEHLPAQ